MPASEFHIHNLVDNSADLRHGKCFLDDPRNELQAAQNWLFERVQANPHLRDRFFQIHGDRKLLRESAINNYLLADQKFLRMLQLRAHGRDLLAP